MNEKGKLGRDDSTEKSSMWPCWMRESQAMNPKQNKTKQNKNTTHKTQTHHANTNTNTKHKPTQDTTEF